MTPPNWQRLVEAARAVLERRSDQMLTQAEWDELADAVRDCGGQVDQTRQEETK